MKTIFFILIYSLMVLFSKTLMAHPTSYEGGFALMSEMHPKNQEISLIYSPKWWLGTGVIGMRSPDKFKLVSTQIGWLVNRWNLPEAQGNFYLLGGVGHGSTFDRQLNEEKGILYRAGLQLDYETRKIYTFARFIEHRFLDNSKLVSNQLILAAGFAPYLGEFTELNTWIIFRVVATHNFSEWIYVPMLRFFYKNFLWEIGQDFDGQSQFNFMVRF